MKTTTTASLVAALCAAPELASSSPTTRPLGPDDDADRHLTPWQNNSVINRRPAGNSFGVWDVVANDNNQDGQRILSISDWD